MECTHARAHMHTLAHARSHAAIQIAVRPIALIIERDVKINVTRASRARLARARFKTKFKVRVEWERGGAQPLYIAALQPPHCHPIINSRNHIGRDFITINASGREGASATIADANVDR